MLGPVHITEKTGDHAFLIGSGAWSCHSRSLNVIGWGMKGWDLELNARTAALAAAPHPRRHQRLTIQFVD